MVRTSGRTEERFGLPFALALRLMADQPAVVLHGQLDVVALLDEHHALVLDFQLAAAPPKAGHAEALRLGVLRRAAQTLLPEGVKVEVGAIYLRDRKGQATLPEPIGAMQLDAEVRLVAQEVQAARREARWPGVEVNRCRAAGCGYLYRCYPDQVAAK